MKNMKGVANIGLIIIGLIIAYLLAQNNGLQGFNWQQSYGQPYVVLQQIAESANYFVSISITPNDVCTGQQITGIITSNMPFGKCSAYADNKFLTNADLDASGSFTYSNSIGMAGSITIKVICCDNQNNCKSSNDVILTVRNCGTTTVGTTTVSPTTTTPVTTTTGLGKTACEASYPLPKSQTDCSLRYCSNLRYRCVFHLGKLLGKNYCTCELGLTTTPTTSPTTTIGTYTMSGTECANWGLNNGGNYHNSIISNDNSDWTNDGCRNYAIASCGPNGFSAYNYYVNCCVWNCNLATTTTFTTTATTTPTTIPNCLYDCNQAGYTHGTFTGSVWTESGCAAHGMSMCGGQGNGLSASRCNSGNMCCCYRCNNPI